LAACSPAPPPPVERIAVLPFENLTGDGALDWIASAGPAVVASEITGGQRILAMRLASLSDAYRAQATRFVHGYFTERAGAALHFEIEIEDASSHKMLKTTAVDGGVLTAMDAVAKFLTPSVRSFSTANAEALEAWGHSHDELAVSLDPDFGAAWLAWAQKFAAEGNPSRAAEVAEQALARPGLRSAVERAQIEMTAANLRKDRDGQRTALAALVRLQPADTSLIETLAKLEFDERNFTDAAEQYRNLVRLSPPRNINTAQAMNSLGYAEAYAGNLDAARKVLEDYGREPGQRSNSLDSLGEVMFIRGRFGEAEKSFLQSHEADAKLLNGGALRKAAYARWLGGDLKGADGLMKRYLEFRANLHDPLLHWREAVWDFETGRRDQAIGKLQSVAPNEKELAEKQMAVWRGAVAIPTELSALKELYNRTPPQADGEVRTFYAAALLAAGQKDQARKLLELWPLPDSGSETLLQSLVYPKFLELRRAME
jgi:tetratricopeptide (TPR) repeat protein